jgi:hypothetical protein
VIGIAKDATTEVEPVGGFGWFFASISEGWMSIRRRIAMKHYLTIVLFALTLILMAVSSSGRGTTRTEMSGSPAPTPTPTAVPGTELRHNVAPVKPGYEFVKRERSVDVVNTRKSFRTGTYVCPCSSNDPNRKCDIVFSPTQITCKNGSCSSGSCLLTAAPLVMSQ